MYCYSATTTTASQMKLHGTDQQPLHQHQPLHLHLHQQRVLTRSAEAAVVEEEAEAEEWVACLVLSVQEQS